MQKRAEKRAYIRRLKARTTEAMPLAKRIPTVLVIDCRALTNRVWDDVDFTIYADGSSPLGGYGV